MLILLNKPEVYNSRVTWPDSLPSASLSRNRLLTTDIIREKFTIIYNSVEILKLDKITKLLGQVAVYSYFSKE